VFTAEEEEIWELGDAETEGAGDPEKEGGGDTRPVQLATEAQPTVEPGAPRVGEGHAEAGLGRHGLSHAEPPLVWSDYYIKLKLAFRKSALSTLKGAPLSVFLCLALHMNNCGTACVGIEALMKETGYSRRPVCAALDELESLRLISKQAARQGVQAYSLRGYAWMGRKPAPALFETGKAQGPKKGGSEK
jgi:hypothetical protein